MFRLTQSRLCTAGVLFFAVQFYLTLFGGFLWPFSSHRLFSQLPERTKWIVQARVTDTQNVTQYVHPGRVIPLEYSRCSGLVRNIFKSSHKLPFRNYVLSRINKEPWTTFDEMFPMVQASPSSMFTSVAFVEQLVEFGKDGSLTVLEVRNVSERPHSPFEPSVSYFPKILYAAATVILAQMTHRNNLLAKWVNRQNPARVPSLKKCLYFAVLVLVCWGPSEFYRDTDRFLYNCRLQSLGNSFDMVRAGLISTCIVNYLRYSKLGHSVFAGLLARYMYHITCFSTSYWITNTHLLWLACIMCLPPRYNKFIVAWATAYFSFMYLQAGLSKLLLGGVSWFTTGSRIWTETILLGTPFGKYMTRWPKLFAPAGWATGIFEIILAPLLLSDRYKRQVAVCALVFHLGTFAMMGISFWFAWIFYWGLYA